MPINTNILDKKILSGPDLGASDLKTINKHLSKLNPMQILEWSIKHLPNLHQTTAFGLSGLVALDMIHKLSIEQDQPHLVPLIFINTLYHFQETLQVLKECQEKYHCNIFIVKPLRMDSAQAFEQEYGPQLWESDSSAYDYLVKVEPAQRIYQEQQVKSVITGRRRSQQGDRGTIPVLEVDSTGLIKLNPLAYWDFDQVWTYIRANEVPYNRLIDQGYRSIGDWHSTVKPGDTTDERGGRWQGQAKTECGLHEDYFEMRAAFIAFKKKSEQQESKHVITMSS